MTHPYVEARMRRLAFLTLALLVVAVPAARANMAQESIFEDGTVLLQKGPARQASALDEIAGLGADTVRALVFWRDVARSPDARKRPKTSFSATGFDRYDDLVRGATARGLKVLLTPVGPTPRWASGCRRPPSSQRGCKPSPARYGAFVAALGRRYSGTYADENQGGGLLPRVDRWSFWNEPNQAGWLSPQYARRGGGVVNVAAVRYRKLAERAVAALRTTGHGSDVLLLGETAPVGRTSGKLAIRAADPTTFVKTLLCEGRYRRRAGCGKARRLRVGGFAHHPYTMGAHDAPGARLSPGQISFDNVSVLQRLLDRSRVVRRGLPIWYTEFGYQTNPPDPRLGVPPAQAATYLNQADYVAARNARIRSVSQYKLVDDQDQASFQTGLRRYGSLRRKETYAAYRLPIYPVRRGGEVSVYGQLRPAPNGEAAFVEIQRAASARGPWSKVQDITVKTRYHQFRFRVPYRRGVYRLAYTPAGGGATVYSRAATPARR